MDGHEYIVEDGLYQERASQHLNKNQPYSVRSIDVGPSIWQTVDQYRLSECWSWPLPWEYCQTPRRLGLFVHFLWGSSDQFNRLSRQQRWCVMRFWRARKPFLPISIRLATARRLFFYVDIFCILKISSWRMLHVRIIRICWFLSTSVCGLSWTARHMRRRFSQY